MERIDDFLDISQLKNQVKLAVMVSNVFELNELIDLVDSLDNIDIYNHENQDNMDRIEILLDKFYNNDKNVQLLDIFFILWYLID